MYLFVHTHFSRLWASAEVSAPLVFGHDCLSDCWLSTIMYLSLTSFETISPILHPFFQYSGELQSKTCCHPAVWQREVGVAVEGIDDFPTEIFLQNNYPIMTVSSRLLCKGVTHFSLLSTIANGGVKSGKIFFWAEISGAAYVQCYSSSSLPLKSRTAATDTCWSHRLVSVWSEWAFSRSVSCSCRIKDPRCISYTNNTAFPRMGWTTNVDHRLRWTTWELSKSYVKLSWSSPSGGLQYGPKTLIPKLFAIKMQPNRVHLKYFFLPKDVYLPCSGIHFLSSVWF